MINQANRSQLEQDLVDAVINQIKYDISFGDETAIDELLGFVPVEYLMGYLPEEDAQKYSSLLKPNKTI
jgi:hypothetical protein